MDAWNDNTLSYLDVLRDVYSSLSFPGYPATEGIEDADPVMAGVTGQQQVGKEERKMGREWEEAGDYETAHQYLALHHEQEAGEEGEYSGGDGDEDEEEDEAGVGNGGKSLRAQHRRQYRNRKYRRLAQNPSSEGLATSMSSGNCNSSLLLNNDSSCSSSSTGRRRRSDSMAMVGEEEVEEKGRAATIVPVGGEYPGAVGLGKGKQFLFRPPLSPASSPKQSNGTSTSTNGSSKYVPRTRPKRGCSSSSNSGAAAASAVSSSSGSSTRNRRRAAVKAEEAIHRAQGGREGMNEGGSEEENANRRSSGGGGGGGRRRKPSENGSEDEEEEEEEEEGDGELDEALMNLRFPAQHETDFVGAVFKLGLKCSSPKVLMDLMPMTETLTTEHIKSHLQKYRLHGNRSKEEFVEYFNGYMRGPFASFCARREWEHERGAEGGAEGGMEGGMLPALFAHGHRRLPMPLSGGSRQHHLQQVQMLTGQLLQTQLELQAQVQHYITSQVNIQSELVKDTVSSSMEVIGGGPREGRREGGREGGQEGRCPEEEMLPPLTVDEEEGGKGGREEGKGFPYTPSSCLQLMPSTAMAAAAAAAASMRGVGEGGREGGEGGREGGGGLEALAAEARILEEASRGRRQQQQQQYQQQYQQQDTLSSLEDDEEDEEDEEGGKEGGWGAGKSFQSRPRALTVVAL